VYYLLIATHARTYFVEKSLQLALNSDFPHPFIGSCLPMSTPQRSDAPYSSPPTRVSPSLSWLQGVHFLGPGIAIPYFPLWLEGRGLSGTQVGLLLALPVLARIVLLPFIMGLVDRRMATARLLLLFDLTLALCYVGFMSTALMMGASQMVLIALLCIIMAVSQSATIPLCDAMTLHALRTDNTLSYGRIRVWGSISFVVATLGAGWWIGQASFEIIPVLLCGISLLAALIVWFAPPLFWQIFAYDEVNDTVSHTKISLALWGVITGAALIQASHAAIYVFGSLYWQGRGYSPLHISLFWGLGVCAEISLFYFMGSRLRSPKRALWVLIGGGVIAMMRFGLLRFDLGTDGMIIMQLLHAGSFGATHLATMALLAQLAPPHQRGRVQGYLSSASALTMGVATAMSGFLFDQWGAGMFSAMALWAACGVICVVFASHSFHKNSISAVSTQPHNNGEGGETTLPS
jgi:MFS transporter, PPP family, 3-phenylpropionic acid transporter